LYKKKCIIILFFFFLSLTINSVSADYTLIDTLSFGGTLTVDSENPILSGESPTDSATGIGTSPDLYVICTHPNSETMTATWRSNSSGSWETFAVNTSISTGTNITQQNTNFSAATTKYWWSINVTDGTNWVNATYSLTTRASYTAGVPTDFSATTVSHSQISLSWTKGSNSDYTYIERYSSSSWEKGVGTEIYNDTGIATTDSGLTEGTTYYYQAWGYNSSDNVWSTTNASDNAVTQSFTLIDTLSFGGILYVAEGDTPPTQSSESPTNGSTDISREPSLSVTCKDVNLDTLSAYWYSNSSGSWERFAYDLSFSSPDIITQTNSNFTGYNTTYYWSVNLTDGNNWTNATYHFTTIDAGTTGTFTVLDTLSFGGWLRIDSQEPAINSVSPVNESIDQSLFPTLTVDVIDYQGDIFTINWSINSSTDVFSATNTSCTNGEYSQVATFANQTNTIYWWTVNISDGTNWVNESFWFVTTSGGNWSNYSDMWTFVYAPPDFVPQSSFKAININDSKINLTWTVPTNTSHNYIRRQVDSAPETRTDGIFVANTTSDGFDDTDLDAGTHYYYSIWGYNSTLNVFTTNYNTTDNYTNPTTPYDFVATDVTMDSIDLSWNKGTNSTNSVIIINESGWANFPDSVTNGTEVYNNTAESTTIENLVANTTYYFTLFTFNPDSGNWSIGNTTTNETTVASAGQPTSFVATTTNSTRIVLTWTKPTGDDTVIRMQKSSYPTLTTGTEIYNGSGETYTATGLDVGTHYYFTAWGWNTISFSSLSDQTDNITTPAPPTRLIGALSGTTLTITWDKGVNATRTILANNTASYPTDPEGTDVFYNGTAETEQVEDVTSVDYYTGWSYALIDGEYLYSEAVELLWGGLEINAYKQNNPSIEILNYTVFITNSDGTETYENTSQNNPTRIDVADVPNGEDISITVSKDGYYPQTIINDLYENFYYQIDFYLPSHPDGGGDSDEPDYVPPSDYEDTLQTTSSSVANPDVDLVITLECVPETIVQVQGYNSSTYGGWFVIPNDKYSVNSDVITINATVMNDDTSTVQVQYYCSSNESYGYQYLVTVQDTASSPVEDAKIKIMTYINSTDSWETTYTLYTDGSGQIDVYLIPGTLYKINITKNGYKSSDADWQPSENVFTKTFVIDFEDSELPDENTVTSCIDIVGEMDSNIIFVNLTNLCTDYNTVTDIQIYVYEVNLTTTNTTLINTSSCSSSCDIYNLVLTSVNNSNDFTIKVFFNTTVWENQTVEFQLTGTEHYEPATTGEDINRTIGVLFGYNPFGWHNLIMWIILFVGLLSADEKHYGWVLILIGFVTLFLNIVVGFDSLLGSIVGGAVPLLFIIVGFLTSWDNRKKKT